MKSLSAIVSLAVLTVAVPSPVLDQRQGASGAIKSQGQVECGDTSRAFCFDEVVWGKGQDYQTVLHSYCQDQYADDALSCHGCMRQPFPTNLCAAAPRAWNSAFVCTEGGYRFAYRCENWCSGGQCA